MTEYEKLVPLEVREFVFVFIEQARAALKKDGYLTPVAVVGQFGGATEIIGGLGNMPKDVSVALIRKRAARINADFTLFVDEIWMKAFTTETETEDARKEYGEVRNMPGRIDAVMFMVETHIGQFVGNAVREGKEGAYTFGEVKFDFMQAASGRYVGLLPPRGAKQ